MTFTGKRRETLDVCEKRCNECLFSKNKIVSDERRDEILAEVDGNGLNGSFECHKHANAGRSVICRGDYDRDPARTVVMRMARALGLVQLVDLDGEDVP